MSKFFGALLLIAFIGTASAECAVEDVVKCVTPLSTNAVTCASVATYAACLTGINCYHDETLVGETMTAKKVCEAQVADLDAPGPEACPATT